MNWTIESAKQHFAEVINKAAQEPQPVFNELGLVAAIIDAQTFNKFQQWQFTQQRSISNAFKELRQLCIEENYYLELPNRYDRENAFIISES